MSLLSWLFGRRASVLRTTVWFDEASRMRGLERDVQEDLAAGRTVVVVAHFAKSLVEAGEHLAAAGVPFRTLSAWQPSPASPTCLALLAKALPQPTPGESPKAKTGGAATLVVRAVDVHVKESENARLLRFAEWSSVPTEVSASTSLEGPVFATVHKPWLAPMLKSMGMKPDDPIESPMVSRSLQKALRQLERRTRRDLPADSVAQWIERNVDPE